MALYEAGDAPRWQAASAMCLRGLVAENGGDEQTALAWYQRAYERDLASGNESIGVTVHSGRLLWDSGRRAEAEQALSHGLLANARLGNRLLTAGHLVALARLAIAEEALAGGTRLLAAGHRFTDEAGVSPEFGGRDGRLRRELSNGLGQEAFAAAWQEGEAMTL